MRCACRRLPAAGRLVVRPTSTCNLVITLQEGHYGARGSPVLLDYTPPPAPFTTNFTSIITFFPFCFTSSSSSSSSSSNRKQNIYLLLSHCIKPEFSTCLLFAPWTPFESLMKPTNPFSKNIFKCIKWRE